MDRLPPIISGFTEAAGRISGIASLILQDRLELLALELREAKIRFVQALLLACLGVVFTLLGLLLVVLGVLYVLPPEWRVFGVAVAATMSILAGLIVFIALRRHLERSPLTFDQSIAELKKDMSCFSIKN